LNAGGATEMARRTTERAEVVRVTLTRAEAVTAERVPALRELFGIDRLPFATTTAEIEIRGVGTAVVNALRRALTDEMEGHALQVAPGGFDTAATTDPLMLPQFVNQRIALVPLPAQIPDEVVANLRLRLDVTNAGAGPMAAFTGDLVVVEGAMTEPLFNPTFELLFVQPGTRLVVNDIRVATGVGRDHAEFIVARRAALRHLDLPQFDERDTHDEGGAAVDASGYKVSVFLADPRHHVLSAEFPATTAAEEARVTVANACASVRDRLRLVLSAVDRRPGEAPAAGGVQYVTVQLDSGLNEGILQVPGETYTVGEVLCRAVHERAPDVSNVAYEIVAHENRMRFTVRHAGDVTAVLADAARHSVGVFEAIQRGVMSR
jgi:DNA-directed RNA polymerase subunit L